MELLFRAEGELAGGQSLDIGQTELLQQVDQSCIEFDGDGPPLGQLADTGPALPAMEQRSCQIHRTGDREEQNGHHRATRPAEPSAGGGDELLDLAQEGQFPLHQSGEVQPDDVDRLPQGGVDQGILLRFGVVHPLEPE